MANPQTEHGYTKVANELLEAVLLADLGKREQKVVWAVIRQTYGYNRKEDAVSIFQIAQLTGMDRRNAARTLNGLIEAKVINARPSGRKSHGVEISSLSVNKDYTAWQTGAKTTPVVDERTGAETTPVEDDQTGVKTTPGSKQHRGQNNPRNRGQIDPKTGVKTTPSKDSKDSKESTQRARDSLPCPPGVSEAVWQDWLKHRKNIKAPLTQSAWTQIEKQLRELESDGWTRDEVLSEVMSAGWRGLQAEWIRNRCGKPNKTRGGTLDDASPV